MKTIIYLFLWGFLMAHYPAFSQNSDENNPQIDLQVVEVGVTITEIEDLETIDWKEIFDLYQSNKASDSIGVYLRLKDVSGVMDTGQKFHFKNFKYEVAGKVSERKRLQEQMDTITDRLKRKFLP